MADSIGNLDDVGNLPVRQPIITCSLASQEPLKRIPGLGAHDAIGSQAGSGLEAFHPALRGRAEVAVDGNDTEYRLHLANGRPLVALADSRLPVRPNLVRLSQARQAFPMGVLVQCLLWACRRGPQRRPMQICSKFGPVQPTVLG